MIVYVVSHFGSNDPDPHVSGVFFSLEKAKQDVEEIIEQNFIKDNEVLPVPEDDGKGEILYRIFRDYSTSFYSITTHVVVE